MRTFVVNLEESVERRAFMTRQLENLGIGYEFSPAVNGRKLTPEQMDAMCDMEKVRAWPQLLTPGMIGCTLSHYHLYLRMVAEKIPLALILEDDTLLSNAVAPLIVQIEKKFIDGVLSREEPLLLYFQSKLPVTFSTRSQIQLDQEYSLNYPVNIWQPITTAAYIMTYECALKLIDLVFPVRFSPDSWGVFHRDKAIQGLRCLLPLPIQSGYFKSDIGYELDKPLNNFVKKLERNNVFPVKQLLSRRRRVLAQKRNRYSVKDVALDWR